MEKRTKLGVAATSLAVAATMIGPTPASASVICIDPCDPITSPGGDGFVFYKLTDVYNKISAIVDVPDSVFIKFDLKT